MSKYKANLHHFPSINISYLISQRLGYIILIHLHVLVVIEVQDYVVKFQRHQRYTYINAKNKNNLIHQPDWRIIIENSI